MKAGEAKERESKWAEAAAFYEQAASVYDGLGQGSAGQWEGALELAAGCCEKAGVHGRAAVHFETIERFQVRGEAGRGEDGEVQLCVEVARSG